MRSELNKTERTDEERLVIIDNKKRVCCCYCQWVAPLSHGPIHQRFSSLQSEVKTIVYPNTVHTKPL